MRTWVFLSAVTAEFGDLKAKIDFALRRAECGVHSQSHFAHTGRGTLLKLDHYIQRSDVVLQLIGEQLGEAPHVRDIAEYLNMRPVSAPFERWLGELGAVSYTQWEALLALYHKKKLLIYLDLSKAKGMHVSQRRYLAWLKDMDEHSDTFDTTEQLLLKLVGDVEALRWSCERPSARVCIQEVEFALVNQLYVSARAFTSGEPWKPALPRLEQLHEWVARERDGRRFRLPTLQELNEARLSKHLSVEAKIREICMHQQEVCTVDGSGRIRRLNLLNEHRRDLIGWRVVFEAERS